MEDEFTRAPTPLNARVSLQWKTVKTTSINLNIFYFNNPFFLPFLQTHTHIPKGENGIYISKKSKSIVAFPALYSFVHSFFNQRVCLKSTLHLTLWEGYNSAMENTGLTFFKLILQQFLSKALKSPLLQYPSQCHTENCDVPSLFIKLFVYRKWELHFSQ